MSTSKIIKKQPHVIKLSTWRMVHMACAVGISFFMLPFLINHLGKHYYGIWILISLFSTYYGMADLGLSTATQRYIAQSIGKNDPNTINEIVATSIVSYGLLSIMVLIFGIIGYILIPHLFHWDLSDITLLKNCFIIMIIGLSFTFPFRSFTGMLGAALRQDISAKTDILYVLAKAVGTVIVVYSNKSIVYLSLVSVLVDFIYHILIFYIVKNVYITLRIDFGYAKLEMGKQLFRYAFFSFLNRVSELLKLRIDAMVISIFMVVSDVTVYSVASRLFDYFNEIIVSIVGFSDAYFARHDGSKEIDKMTFVLSNFTKTTTVISVFIGLSLILYGKYFIVRWVGYEFIQSFPVLICLVAPGILYAIQDPLRRLFFATSKHHLLSYMSLLEGVLNTILSLILVKFYGLIGVALGTAIPSLLFSIIFIPIYGCSIIRFSLREYWFKLVVLPGLATGFFVLGFVSLTSRYLAADFIRILVLSIFQTIVFVPYCYFIFLNKSGRIFVIQSIKNRCCKS